MTARQATNLGNASLDQGAENHVLSEHGTCAGAAVRVACLLVSLCGFAAADWAYPGTEPDWQDYGLTRRPLLSRPWMLASRPYDHAEPRVSLSPASSLNSSVHTRRYTWGSALTQGIFPPVQETRGSPQYQRPKTSTKCYSLSSCFFAHFYTHTRSPIKPGMDSARWLRLDSASHGCPVQRSR